MWNSFLMLSLIALSVAVLTWFALYNRVFIDWMNRYHKED